ncbi:MAG: hypothetical protein JSS49_27800 [Planctomycetes bacterium]|nr:hypothetical protein [Planctomycetota bacterium]
MFSHRFLRLSWPVVLSALMVVGLAYSNVRSQDNRAVEDANATLQAVGGLGVGHIQSTLGLIGVTADAYAKDVYTPKQVEDLMNGTVNGIEAVKKLLRRLQETDLGDDDREYIDRMISVYNGLQKEAKALIAFAKSRKPADAELFDAARKSAVTKLGQLTDGDKLPIEATETEKVE